MLNFNVKNKIKKKNPGSSLLQPIEPSFHESIFFARKSHGEHSPTPVADYYFPSAISIPTPVNRDEIPICLSFI